MKLNLQSVILSILFVMFALNSSAQIKKNWQLSGDRAIVFDAQKSDNLPYADNIEMAGKRCAAIVSYKVSDKGVLSLSREVFFPQLHQFRPSTSTTFFNYRAYMQDSYGDDLLPKLYTGEQQFVPGAVSKISIDGILHFVHQPSVLGVSLERTLYPSMSDREFVELWTLTNTTDKQMDFVSGNTSLTFEDYGQKGLFTRTVKSDAPASFSLSPGSSISFAMTISATLNDEPAPSHTPQQTLAQREEYIQKVSSSLILESPSPQIDRLFAFSKIRGSESIFESKYGLIHSPGGGRYYVGFWANDQAEYISPLFPYIGYQEGNQSAINCYRAFAKEITPDYKPIRYSFEVEGLPPFIYDRGDAAMIAYGATHFVMALGDEAIARELWPLIEWCLEYNHRNLNDEGVVKSQSDEMEGRIETGDANLSTSSLYYGALHHAIYLAKSLDMPKKQIASYRTNMQNLAESIENYFGSNVEGLDTYKYYKEHTALRHWICLPLCVGIFDRKDATIEALFNRLWSDNGVHVERNNPKKGVSDIFWDRGTLYALRGAFFSGETEHSYQRLLQFTQQRLLGDRVPYVVEASPEGAMAHLSAESGLYCRIFTEGIMGIEPISLSGFQMRPNLPKEWDFMNLRRIKAFGHDFDIQIKRVDNMLNVSIVENGKTLLSRNIKEGAELVYNFKN